MNEVRQNSMEWIAIWGMGVEEGLGRSLVTSVDDVEQFDTIKMTVEMGEVCGFVCLRRRIDGTHWLAQQQRVEEPDDVYAVRSYYSIP